MALVLQAKSVRLKTKSTTLKLGGRNIQSLGNMTSKQHQKAFFGIKRRAMLPSLKEYGLFGAEKGLSVSKTGLTAGIKTGYAVSLGTMGLTPNSKAGVGAGTNMAPTYDENREATSHIERTRVSARNVLKGTDVVYKGTDKATIKIGQHNLKNLLLQKGVSKEVATTIAKSEVPMTVSEMTNLGVELNTAKQVAESFNHASVQEQIFSPTRRNIFSVGVKQKTGSYVKYRAKHTAAGQAAKKFAVKMRASTFGQGVSTVWNNNIVKGARTFITKVFALPFKLVKAISDALALISGAILPLIFLLFFIMVLVAILDDDASQKRSSNFATNVNLSETVLQYKGAVSEACSKHGISEYVPYILAIMEEESHGIGNDVMQSSESLGLPPNSLSVKESIEQGVSYFSSLIKQGASLGVTDIDAVLQAYNFGGGYLYYVSQNGWMHTYSLAKQFSKEKALEWGDPNTYTYINEVSKKHGDQFLYGYGNFHYVDLVKQHISEVKTNRIGTGDRDENGIPRVPVMRQGYGGGYWNPETEEFEHTDWPYQSFWGGDLANWGCSVTSAAMALSYISGEIYNPVEMGLRTLPSNNFLRYLTPVQEYNIEYEFNISWDRAVQELKNGNMVIALLDSTVVPGLGSYSQNRKTDMWAFEPGGSHFILLIGILEDGTIAVNDPGSKSDVSYWYKNRKITIPQHLISPAFVGSGSSIIYIPEGLGAISNPYGDINFAITDVACLNRVHPVTGEIKRHNGWDFAAGGFGTPIYSVTDGTVVWAGPFGGYGNHVVIVESGDLYVLYGHMSSMSVAVGESVSSGDKLGGQGTEGISTGVHLHLEFRTGSMYGTPTANKDLVVPMLNRYANNLSSYSDSIDKIEN